MKKDYITLIIVITVMSGLLSFGIATFLFSGSRNLQEKVETVEPITDSFEQPDKKYFNEHSIDPTQLIQIGDNNNTQPFNKQ